MLVNPIPRASLWVTPKSFEELQAMADACSIPSDAYNIMMMTFNYCRKLVDHLEQEQMMDGNQFRLFA